MSAQLVARRLSYEVGRARLLAQVSSRFDSGQLTMLIGNNGAGKTTLLRTLAGFLKPTSGSVSINGDDLRTLSLKALARRRAVLPQHDALNASFSVQEIVAFAALPYTHRTIHRRIAGLFAEIIESLEIKHLQQRLYHSLSGGERQRVRLARVILQARLSEQPPGWLLLDEPLTYLDWGHQHKLLAYLHRLADEGLGVLAILHDLNLARQYAAQLCLLHNGKMLAFGKSREVLSQDNVRNVFGMDVAIDRSSSNLGVSV